MNKYSADIGTWERFVVYEFEAPNDESALNMAFDHWRKNKKKYGSDSDVVQLYCGKVLVWDYYGNGRIKER